MIFTDSTVFLQEIIKTNSVEKINFVRILNYYYLKSNKKS